MNVCGIFKPALNFHVYLYLHFDSTVSASQMYPPLTLCITLLIIKQTSCISQLMSTELILMTLRLERCNQPLLSLLFFLPFPTFS